MLLRDLCEELGLTVRLLLLVLTTLTLTPGSLALPNAPVQADRIIVFKAKRTMYLYQGEKVLKTYKVALGSRPQGPKTQQGDHKTPEGVYKIDGKNSKSLYHLSLHISYPNVQDRAQARKRGVNPGGDIMIHGLPDAYAYLGPLHLQHDWTEGCIAVTNAEIEEIWKLVPIGTLVEIMP